MKGTHSLVLRVFVEGRMDFFPITKKHREVICLPVNKYHVVFGLACCKHVGGWPRLTTTWNQDHWGSEEGSVPTPAIIGPSVCLFDGRNMYLFTYIKREPLPVATTGSRCSAPAAGVFFCALVFLVNLNGSVLHPVPLRLANTQLNKIFF